MCKVHIRDIEDGSNTEWLPSTPGTHSTCLSQLFHLLAECGEWLYVSWWRHSMETFSALLVICAENSPVPGEFPTQRPVTRSFYVYFDLRPNRRLNKQSWGWWFETPSRPLWRHRNVLRDRYTRISFHVHSKHICCMKHIHVTKTYAYQVCTRMWARIDIMHVNIHLHTQVFVRT